MKILILLVMLAIVFGCMPLYARIYEALFMLLFACISGDFGMLVQFDLVMPLVIGAVIVVALGVLRAVFYS